jgi:hypothetical protein
MVRGKIELDGDVHFVQNALFGASELWAKPLSQNLEQCVARSKDYACKCYKFAKLISL